MRYSTVSTILMFILVAMTDLPSAITHVNMVLDGRSVWFAGGFKDGYKGYAIGEVWKYDIDKNTWEMKKVPFKQLID